jgi:hypothetical protein
MSAIFEFDSRLDREYLDNLYEGNLNHAMNMFEIYIGRYPENMEKCRELIFSEVDNGRKELFVHKRMNAFGMVGLTYMANMRHDLEFLFRQGNTTAAYQQFSLIYEAFSQTLPIIIQEYNRLKEFVAQYSKC